MRMTIIRVSIHLYNLMMDGVCCILKLGVILSLPFLFLTFLFKPHKSGII